MNIYQLNYKLYQIKINIWILYLIVKYKIQLMYKYSNWIEDYLVYLIIV